MPLSSSDPAISSLISKERIRQTEGAELIASENYTSENVMSLDWIDGISIRETEALQSPRTIENEALEQVRDKEHCRK